MYKYGVERFVNKSKGGKMKNRLGFTLAEVLITLVIIGVIAAMTIPSLLQNTNQQEYISAAKKAVSALNQAITLNYALDGEDAGDSTSSLYTMFNKRLSIATTISNTEGAPHFVTADGIEYTFSTAVACGETGRNVTSSSAVTGSSACATITIDVNANKGPNKLTSGTNSSKGQIRDQFVAYLYPERVVAGTILGQVIYNR